MKELKKKANASAQQFYRFADGQKTLCTYGAMEQCLNKSADALNVAWDD
jgi:hypothetical protein